MTLGILAAMGAVGVTLPATAQTTPASTTVILNTSTTLLKQAPNGPSTKPVGKDTGAGVMDTHMAYDASSGLIASFMTWSSAKPNQNNSYMQGGLALATLTSTGLTAGTFTEMPQLQGNRPFMRPLTAIGSNYILAIFASEDNDVDNGNPQAVAWVFDRQGNLLTISNSTRNDGTNGPTNLIDLSGQNDGQQYGPHSICRVAATASDGTDSFIVGIQRNNQQAKVLRVDVNVTGTTATVKVPYLKTIIENARHNRVSLACPLDGVAHNDQILATAVEANNQPADIGVRAVLVKPSTGAVLTSALISSSDPDNNLYAVQPTAQYVDDTHAVIASQTSAAQNTHGNNNNNGHGNNGSNLSHLTLLRFSADSIEVVDTADRTAPYQRHAEAFALSYGPDGSTIPAIGHIGGSSTGTGKGLVQIIPIDVVNEKIGAVDPLKLYQVSNYSDVAALPARGKNNPQDQARGFIRGLSGIINPGYKNPNGFMPEVKTFSISSVAGYNNMTTDNRESLFFSLIPASWDPTYNTTPGTVQSNVPPGPSPTAPTNAPVTNPGTGVSSGVPTGMPSEPSTGSSSGTAGSHASGFGETSTTAGGCACTTAPGSASTPGAAGMSLLGLGLVLLGLRRNKKEQ